MKKFTNKTINALMSKAKGYTETEDGYIINIELTEEIAKMLLGGNVNNRKVIDSQVSVYASAMKRGEWRPSSDMFIVDKNGNLKNGQHRDIGFIVAGCPNGIHVTILLLTKCDDKRMEEIVRNVDNGKNRSYADTLVFRHICDKTNAAKFETLARKIGYIAARYTQYPKLLNSDYDQIVDMYHSEFEKIAPLIGRKLVADMAAAACVVMHLTNEHDKITTMIKMSHKGTGLEEGTPDLILNRIMQTRLIDAANSRKGHNSLTFAGAGNCFVAKVYDQGMCRRRYDLDKFLSWIEKTSKKTKIAFLPSSAYETFENYKHKKVVK